MTRKELIQKIITAFSDRQESTFPDSYVDFLIKKGIVTVDPEPANL